MTTLMPQSAIFNVHVFVSLHLEHSGSKGGLTSVTPCMWHCMVLYCFFISVAAKLHKIGLNIMQHLSVFGIIYQTLDFVKHSKCIKGTSEKKKLIIRKEHLKGSFIEKVSIFGGLDHVVLIISSNRIVHFTSNICTWFCPHD